VYRVSATWPASANYASDSPFSVYNGTQLLGTSRVSQKVASSGFSDNGSQWRDLGNFTITGSTLAVKLTNAANGWVAADGIRIEKIAEGRTARSSLAGGPAASAGLASLETGAAGTSAVQNATDSIFSDRGNDAWLQHSGSLRAAAQYWQNAAASLRADIEPELTALEKAADLLDDLAAHLGRDRGDTLSNLWD
jgi:hypothetical protein